MFRRSLSAVPQRSDEREPGCRVVLSRVSAASADNGLNRARVAHVMPGQAFASDSLRRSAGQFLCSPHVDAHGGDIGMRRATGGGVVCRNYLARGRTAPRPGGALQEADGSGYTCEAEGDAG
ncbi:hypothetical protein MetexDRAFT_0006 [Methylorubrum extorquens DSM 13060]|uniref:Uncharacterized protein n=2 Tax=Methylorubrum extorquens TaxID=408 RepID=C5B6F8_METEA|nr:Hypothetical protein MexAM1_META2p1299 [Methylorubrum extorquens AM1]EHP95014.1 hypothetical protein MetexDRAFT_0006 [Methylorubrum extorquens DSM 13060]